jgi:two-component system cell cycle response regulator
LARSLRFDGWSLDTDSGELFRDGEKIRLQEQPLQILQALLSTPGRVVTREELVARLWPKGIVDFETGLNTAMRRLRAALREDADAPRYIETLPRRGYRFIGTLDATPATPTPTPLSGQARTQDHELQTQLLGTGEASARRTDCLVIVTAPAQLDVGRRYPLDKDVTTIGRGLENDVVLPSQSVSRRHTRVEFRGGLTYVVDGASTNGTFINSGDKPVRDGPLHPGDLLHVGDRTFVYLRGTDIDAQYQELVLSMTMTDTASGAASRKHLDTLLSEEIQRAQRHSRPLSLLMMGVDRARERQSEFGELISDSTLRAFVTTLRKRLRPQDRLGRYGDREFCVVMPETTLAGAEKIAEELPVLISGTASGAASLVITIGVTSLEQARQLADMYRAAEESLHQARRRY